VRPAGQQVRRELDAQSDGPRRAQVGELPEALQRELLEGGGGEGSTALAEYRRRFVCRRPGASCLTDSAAGAPLVMQRELCGASLFQVGCAAWSP